MKKLALLFVAAILVTLLHSCNMDHNVIKPNCRVAEADLMTKHWVATSETQSSEVDELIFNANGEIAQPSLESQFQPHNGERKTFMLHFCNKIQVTDDAEGVIQEWTIRELGPEYMRLRFGDNDEVDYAPKK